ncbi:acetoacetate--CoA ligase [Lentzea sp. NPDC058436]|uniref:acetoacetate--CoA ligase n=1 Tax=Lentzea sp. NPDC058436 TaxID=3346499 RepID=UPI0036533C72
MTGEVVWTPAPDARSTSRIGHYLDWLAGRGLTFEGYDDLHAWSVADVGAFWQSIWDHFEVRAHTPPRTALADASMPGARWFPGATLNYAEHAFRAAPDAIAVHARSQTRPDLTLTFAELEQQVAACRAALRELGVGPGDRVAGYLPNVPEALVAFLATASLGAVWACCALEIGPSGALDRLGQVDPVVLVTAGGYVHGAKRLDRTAEVAAVAGGLSVRHTVDVGYGEWRVGGALQWSELLAEHVDAAPAYEPVPFGHPLAVLFSSGTTGRPKAIVHGHGGVLLEHLKNHALSWDLGPGDCLLWYTTTSWMMWHALVSALLVGASAVLVDGDPAFPGLEWQWRLAEETGATTMGASPGFVMACERAGLRLDDVHLRRLRVFGAAGAPLPESAYRWLRENLGPHVQPSVGSGGTDVCSGLVQDNPLTPSRLGVIAGPCLGVDVHAWDDEGRDVVGEPGELVVLQPMPSMPVGFWGDDGTRLREAYFSTWPGVWRHGDWIVLEPGGGCRVTGRSDATLNRGGVRLGTAEFYGVVERLDGVADSLVVHLEDALGGNGELWLFVVPAHGPPATPVPADDGLRDRVRTALRRELSPRHVPDRVVLVPVVPRTLTGKKLEVPVKRVLLGSDPADVAGRDSLAVPGSLGAFVALRTR